MAPFEALYGRGCRMPLCWYESGESALLGPEVVQETTEKVKRRCRRLSVDRRVIMIEGGRTLSFSCKIYEEDTKAHYKIRNERRNKGQQGRPKPYNAPGHKSNVCNGEEKKCFRCGKKGHTIAECKRGDIVCFNCDEEGHLSSQCKKPKKGQASGRVFALAAQAVGQYPQAGAGNDGVRMLETFLRNHPPTFKGRYDPDGAQKWLKEIRVFSELVNSCKIYEEDTKAHYKIRNERRNKGQQGRPKPYNAPGHKSNVCNGEEKKCFRCGKKGHTIAECKRGDIVCFNCDEEGHLSSQCKKPKKGQASGRVFALAGTQTANEDRLI
ncbi:DNA-binding protein HEXBP-like [Medicago truncatula]|uniref:DNA-binding protein HEXBP-like n=1 Tax=Medicago truncatula TaxID=3880 RepID=UPI001967A78A|nr:DNA-binding protein HEXBP-like [Medicago truncatula]